MKSPDANDILQEHGPDRLRAAFDRSERMNGALDGAASAIGIGKAQPAISPTPFVWADPNTLPRRQWVYGRHYIRKFLSATVAAGGLGKSSLLIAEALAMVTGRDLLNIGHKSAPLRVWYWNGEDPADEIQRRIMAACLFFGLTREDIGNRLFTDSGRIKPMIIAQDAHGETRVATPLVTAVKDEIIANKIDILMVDPFVSAHQVAENDNAKIQMVAHQFAEIADAANSSVELAHHIRKSGNAGEELTADDARGAGALVAKARAVRTLRRMNEDEAQSLADVGDRRRYYRVDDGAKANLAPPADAAAWYFLADVGLGNGDSDGPQDQVGVATPFNRSAKPSSWIDRKGLERQAEETFVKLLAEFNRSGLKASPHTGHNFAPSLFAAHQDAAGIGKKHFVDAMQRLLRNKVIAIGSIGRKSHETAQLIIVESP